MDDEIIRRLEQLLPEAACMEVSLANGLLNLAFGRHRLIVMSAWRLVYKGQIMLAADDNLEATECIERALPLLRDQNVLTVSVSHPFNDLTVEFENGLIIEAFSNSANYENWN